MQNRKFVHFILYLFFIAFFIRYLSVDGDQLFAKGKRESRNALHVMLASPEKENVWYVDPTLKTKLLSVKNGVRNELELAGSSPLFHTYVYKVKTDGVPLFYVEVLLLRKENKFIVKQPTDGALSVGGQ